MKKLTALYIACFCFSILSHAQIFIDNGTNGSLYIRSSSGGTLGDSEVSPSDVALYVDGDITIEGTYDNQATEVQLTGNFTNSGSFTTSGDEVFGGGVAQTITGSLTGGADFHNLIISKSVSTLVSLAANLEIDATGVLSFEGGVIKTGVNYIHVKSTATTSIKGAGGNGGFDKFVEGELRREIIAGNTYEFPVGGTHTDLGGGDGVQYSSFKSNTGNGVVSIVFTENTGIGILDNTVICPSGTGDFKDVEYIINNGLWEITNPGGGISNYNITLNPIDYTDMAYVDYTILKDGIATGRDLCDGAINLPPLTHDSLTSFSIFEVAASTITPLPIDLLSFTAEVTNNNSVKLMWQTASEINNDLFTIERSPNSIDWNVLNKVDGAGNSSSFLNYASYDRTPIIGTSYYRLKQTDFNGEFSYSQMRSVNLDRINTSQIEIYPNPANTQMTITGTKTDLKEISIYNVLGQDVTPQTKKIGNNQLTIDVSNLNTGVYYIKTKTATQKLYKQ